MNILYVFAFQALELLSTSRIRRVHVVGRRGPMNVSFTIKELREMVNLEGCTPVFDKQVKRHQKLHFFPLNYVSLLFRLNIPDVRAN